MPTVEERLSELEIVVFGRPQSLQTEANAPVAATAPPPLPGNWGGWYREPRVQDGHPNTVTMPQTGHVLSIPAPHMKENIIGYMIRTSWQTHGNPGVLGALSGMLNATLGKYGYVDSDPSTWPKAADQFFNEFDYMTPQELAEAQRQMAEWGPRP